MFRCEVSGRLSAPGEEQYTIVTKIRKKEYIETYLNRWGEKQERHAGSGYEIVQEKKVCKSVYLDFIADKSKVPKA